MSHGLQDDKNNKVIQAMPLERANAISPITITNETVIEFTEAGDVDITLNDDTVNVKTVLAGARYAIGSEVKSIDFAGSFSVH